MPVRHICLSKYLKTAVDGLRSCKPIRINRIRAHTLDFAVTQFFAYVKLYKKRTGPAICRMNGLLCYWKKSWDIRAGCNNIGRRMSSGNIPLEGRTRLPGKVQDCIQDCGLIVAHIQSASHSNEVGSC
ncbi:unnamed protein product [Gongylonema pulchrum]|uniref:Reverse transcriptase n=1 Tax=Gongylonema pulchrum TaxID=637853 RepID=A0A183EDT2_9BILA|nr:unnamed protein product [Gongylonema pulchrum]